jgi:porin
MRLLAVCLICISIFTAGSYARAEDDSGKGSGSFFSGLSSREYMTGDWGGLRNRVIEWGLTPTATYSATVLGNPAGGMSKGVKYAGLLNVYLDFDLEKLLKLGGTKLVVSGSWAYGESLSEDDVGNFFTVSSDFNGKSVSLYQFFIETHLWRDRVTVALGRMGIGDDFATAEVFGVYANDAFNQHPISLSYDIPAYLSNPDAALGARLHVKPVNDFYIAAGLYNANPDAGRNRLLSADIDFTFDGVILISEAGYTPGSSGGSAGLPGEYKIGAYYDTGEFNELADAEDTRSGNYGFYAIADQMVYGEPGDGSQGLTLWATATFAPEEEINTFPLFLSGGCVYEGLLPGRNKDIAGFGFAYGKLSSDLENKDYEIGIEGTYIFQVTPWLGLQPDVQVIIHPGGSSSIPDALVAGMQISVDI